EREAALKRKAEEDARHRQDDDARRKAEDESRRRVEAEERAAKAPAAAATSAPAAKTTPAAATTPGTKPGAPAPAARRVVEEDEDDAAARRRAAAKGLAPKPAAPARKTTDDRRRAGKLSVVTALDENERVRSIAAYKRHVQRAQRAQMGLKEALAPQKIVRDVVIPEAITVQELANRMATRSVDIIKNLMKQGQM